MRKPIQPKLLAPLFFFTLVSCFALTHDVQRSQADAVADVPLETLANYMQLSIKDNTLALAPAKKAFSEGNFDECKRMLERAAAESGIVPHPDVQMASWFMAAGRMNQAVQLLEQIGRTDPNRPDVRWLFAEVARLQGRWFDAWTQATLGEQCDPPENWDPEYGVHMKQMLARTKALVADQRGDWKESERLFKEMIKQGVRTPEVDLALGRATLFQDRPEEAFKFFQNACKPESITLVPELLMASLYEQKGEPEKTEEWFRKGEAGGALDADRIRLEYARWLIRQNRAGDAVKVATKFKPSEQYRADLESMIALAERMKGNFPVAEKILSRLNLASPQSFAISNQLALVLVESDDQGKLGRAMQLATNNLRNNPNSMDAAATYGWVQHRTGDSAGADQTFNVILQSGQISRDVAYYLSEVKFALVQPEVANLLLERAKNSQGEFFNAFRVDAKKEEKKEEKK